MTSTCRPTPNQTKVECVALWCNLGQHEHRANKMDSWVPWKTWKFITSNLLYLLLCETDHCQKPYVLICYHLAHDSLSLTPSLNWLPMTIHLSPTGCRKGTHVMWPCPRHSPCSQPLSISPHATADLVKVLTHNYGLLQKSEICIFPKVCLLHASQYTPLNPIIHLCMSL
jgi:hypothetical protein